MLEPYRTFLAVMEEGSLNRAAAKLRVSQPALSRQMQALEGEVGGRLFERTPGGMRPTDVAHALAARMRGVIASYDAAIAEARRLAHGERDQLRIGYLASAARQYLNPALARLRKAHPKVQVKLMDLSPGEQIAALRKGEIDVGLIGQEGCVAAREFYTRKLATLPLIAILPADHRLASRKRIRLADLRDERFLSAPAEDLPGRDRWIAQLCRKAGFKVCFAEQAESVGEMFSLVNSTGSIGIGPAYLRDVAGAGLATPAISDAGATWDFLVVWQRGRTAGPMQVFLAALPDDRRNPVPDSRK